VKSEKTIWKKLLEVISGGFKTESEMLEKMHRRLAEDFLDMLILLKLSKGSLSGNDIISYIHKRFDMFVSAGTIYSCLFHLEKNELIRGELVNGKKVYTITEKGNENVKTLLTMRNKILGLVVDLFIN